jgi:peptidoglycan/xylan/chitin deacetylase (PgdA/CDA1 family)
MGKIQVSTGTGSTSNVTTVWDRIIDLENNVGSGGNGLTSRVSAVESSLAQKASQTQLAPTNIYNGPIVTIIDDDSYDQFFSQWKPMCDLKNIKVTLAITNNSLDTSSKLTLAELKQLKAEGFDIVSHGFTHPDVNTVDEATWEMNCSESKNFILSNDLGLGETMVYPIGFTTAGKTQINMVKRVTRKYFKYGVDALGGVNTLPVDSFRVKRQGMRTTYEDNKAVIDEAIAKNGWLIFLTHSNAAWDNTMVNQMIDYIQSNNIPILTFTEAEKLVGNSLSYGDGDTENYFFAGRNGAVKFNQTPQPKNFTMDMAIDNYVLNKTTISNVLNNQDTLLSTGGVLHTYRGNTFMSYQMYYPVQSSVVYKREWDDTNSVWKDWYQITNTVRRKLTTGNTMDAPITSYQKDVVTAVYLTNTTDTSFSNGGMMYVYRGNTLYSYAIYVQAVNGSMYKRVWNDTPGTWGSWERVDTVKVRTTANNVMDDSITTYSKNSETIVPVQTANDNYLSIGGVMRVYRAHSDAYSYATFTPFNANTLHMRKWSTGSSTWGAWAKISV